MAIVIHTFWSYVIC